MSSSEDDEDLKQFAEAVDTSLFNNEFYKPAEEKLKKTDKLEQKSQRYLDNTENIFQSELNVSENMKEFISKKMSKLIEESTQYIDVKPKEINEEEVNCLKLFKGCKEYITLDEKDHTAYPKCKIPIKRKIIDDDQLKESSKIQLSVIEPEKIAHEVGSWDKKTRHKAIKYKKGKVGVCHLVEESNEFSKIRSKNGWNESKIKESKYFNEGLQSVIKKNKIKQQQ